MPGPWRGLTHWPPQGPPYGPPYGPPSGPPFGEPDKDKDDAGETHVYIPQSPGMKKEDNYGDCKFHKNLIQLSF